MRGQTATKISGLRNHMGILALPALFAVCVAKFLMAAQRGQAAEVRSKNDVQVTKWEPHDFSFSSEMHIRSGLK